MQVASAVKEIALEVRQEGQSFLKTVLSNRHYLAIAGASPRRYCY